VKKGEGRSGADPTVGDDGGGSNWNAKIGKNILLKGIVGLLCPTPAEGRRDFGRRERPMYTCMNRNKRKG